MGYKKMDHCLGFAPVRSSGPTGQADLELQRFLVYNRSLKLIKNLNAAIDWSKIEPVLMSRYTARPVKDTEIYSEATACWHADCQRSFWLFS